MAATAKGWQKIKDIQSYRWRALYGCIVLSPQNEPALGGSDLKASASSKFQNSISSVEPAEHGQFSKSFARADFQWALDDNYGHYTVHLCKVLKGCKSASHWRTVFAWKIGRTGTLLPLQCKLIAFKLGHSPALGL